MVRSEDSTYRAAEVKLSEVMLGRGRVLTIFKVFFKGSFNAMLRYLHYPLANRGPKGKDLSR